MAGNARTSLAPDTRRRRWLGWFDGALLALCVGSILVVIAGGLVQVSFGSYSMTLLQAWRAVFDPQAILNGRVYAQGGRYQGPILNLFQLEMTAKQLYPEQFGAWPSYADGPYPEIPKDEQLFDRDRVTNAINGAI